MSQNRLVLGACTLAPDTPKPRMTQSVFTHHSLIKNPVNKTQKKSPGKTRKSQPLSFPQNIDCYFADIFFF